MIGFETLKCFNNALKLELLLKFQLNRLVNKNMFAVLGSAFEPGTSQKVTIQLYSNFCIIVVKLYLLMNFKICIFIDSYRLDVSIFNIEILQPVASDTLCIL